MAQKKKAAKKTSKAGKRSQNLKIQSKRAKAKKKTARAKRKNRHLSVKTAKLTRTLRKLRAVAKKALRTAIKSMDITKVPEKTYRKIDAVLVKNADILNAVQAAVVEAANELGTVKTRKPRKRKAAEDAAQE